MGRASMMLTMLGSGMVRVILKPAFPSNAPELVFGTLASAGEDEHFEILPLGEHRIAVHVHQRIENDQLAVFLASERLVDVFQDDVALLVGPVVEDVLHDVCVATSGNGLEIAWAGIEPRASTGTVNARLGAFQDVWQIRGPSYGIVLQDLADEQAVPTADIKNADT